MKLARIALALGLSLATPAHADDPAKAEVFKDAKTGFEIAKPEGWYYFGRERRVRPLVAFSKYREPYDDLNPSFEVHVRPIADLQGMGLPEGLRPILEMQRSVLGARVAQGPSVAEVAGKQAAYARLEYTAETPEGLELPVTSQLWAVPDGDHFFLVDAGTRQDEKTGTRKEIEAILRTIRIAR
jgi:hypothetical protein